MLDKKQLQNEMTGQVRDEIFNRRFERMIQQRLGLAQYDAQKTYAEKVKREEYTVFEGRRKPERFQVEGDDSHKTKKWEALFTDCSFYFDQPTLKQEVEMKKKIQLKYDDLFQEGWRPALQTRKDLVEWACRSHNAYQDEKGIEVTHNCENPGTLIDKFGPDYDVLKSKLGFVKGLF